MPLGNEPSKIKKEILKYQAKKFSFTVNNIQLPNQVEGEFSCINHPGGSLAVPVTNEGLLVLVKQYRFAVQGRILEFPAGTVEINEDPAETIIRELEEETGYRGNKWHKLGEFFIAPGYSDEIIYAFLAQDLEELEQPPEQDLDEDIQVVLMSPKELEKAILNGVAVDAKSVTAFFLAKPFLNLNE